MSYTKISSLLEHLKWLKPQPTPLPNQIANNAGGYYYKIDEWDQLDRFLILGSELGTYYVAPVKLTLDNTQVIQNLLRIDGIRVVNRIVEVSAANRAPKNDSALFALALAASCEDLKTRQAALLALPKVARTGTYLLQFAEYINNLRGWGRSLRKAIANWFLNMPVEDLSLQAVKYYKREGWSLCDLLRLSHPKCKEDEERRALFQWIVKPEDATAIKNARSLRLIDGKYCAKDATTNLEMANIVRKYSLPREALPTPALNSPEVWDALLVDMPMTAMIRNLGKMTKVGLLQPFGAASDYVAKRLHDKEQLRYARISPFQLLLALRVYARGSGELGSLQWTPVASIVQALDKAFESSFADVKPTNKRILVGIDVSGSMCSSTCAGSPILRPVEAAAAVATFFVRTETRAHVMAFDTQAYEFAITPNQRLDDITEACKRWGGGTNLALPITYAIERRLEVDAFVILTDNETWAGNRHAVQALDEYRQRINPEVKLVVMATAANEGAVCDPRDPLSLGIAGFDAAAPQVVLEFIKGSC